MTRQYDGEVTWVPNRTSGLYESSKWGLSKWYSCRVEFHEHSHVKAAESNNGRNYTSFLYNAKAEENQILDVLSQVEERLKLEEKDQLLFKSMGEGVLYIAPSEWWCDPIRFTLLTAFIRDAQTSLKVTLESSTTRYINPTREAVNLFLDGNYFYRGSFYEGWVMTFSDSGRNSLLGSEPSELKTVQVRHHPLSSWKRYTLPLMQR